MSIKKWTTVSGLLVMFVLVALTAVSPSVLGLGTANTEKNVDVPITLTVNGVYYQRAQMALDLAGWAIDYSYAQQLWRNAVSHALRGHEEAVVRCIEWYNFNHSWSEIWLSNTERRQFDGVTLPTAAAVTDLTVIMSAAGALDGPCKDLTDAVIRRDFAANSVDYRKGNKVRLVIYFAKDSIQKGRNVVDKYLPLTMFPVADWEWYRCQHGFTSMIYPTSGYRPCP